MVLEHTLYQQAYERIAAAKKILVVTHDKPDGDALSSVGAIVEILEKLGKEYFIFCNSLAPSQLYFLPHAEKLRNDKTLFDFSDFDTIIALDCGSLGRTNLSAEISNRRPGQFVIEFDHHLKVDDYADIELRDPEAAAAVEIVYDFIRANDIEITKNIATSILTGIVTDTGHFLFPATSEKTMRISSEMLAKGATYPKISQQTWRNKSLGAMKLWGRAIESMVINCKYRIAFTIVTQQDLEDSGVDDEELDGIINFLSNATGVKAVMLLKEDNGKIKGSLRSIDPKVNVAKLANHLCGGGHAKASGFRFNGRLEFIDNRWKII